jgi:Fanconi anemia group I protein
VLFGDLDESRSVEVPRRLLFLTENTADAFLPRFVQRLDTNLDLANQLMVWLRAVASTAIDSGLNLAAREAALCALFANLVNASTELVNTALPVGPTASDLVLKFLGRLYLSMGNLAKYFFLLSRSPDKSVVQAARFDRLVTKVSDDLSPFVYGLISYIDGKHKQAETTAKTGTKKAKVVDASAAQAKVLKETKEIPTLIFHIETYDKNIIKLGKRIKLKFAVKAATVRDFR